MPSKSKAQHNLMEAVAHDPKFAKKAGIKQSVGQDFANADKGRTFKKGGSVAKAHPGFKAVKSKIAKSEGVSGKAAGAILASATQKSSAKAKKANPRLKKVK